MLVIWGNIEYLDSSFNSTIYPLLSKSVLTSLFLHFPMGVGEIGYLGPMEIQTPVLLPITHYYTENEKMTFLMEDP